MLAHATRAVGAARAYAGAAAAARKAVASHVAARGRMVHSQSSALLHPPPPAAAAATATVSQRIPFGADGLTLDDFMHAKDGGAADAAMAREEEERRRATGHAPTADDIPNIPNKVRAHSRSTMPAVRSLHMDAHAPLCSSALFALPRSEFTRSEAFVAQGRAAHQRQLQAPQEHGQVARTRNRVRRGKMSKHRRVLGRKGGNRSA